MLWKKALLNIWLFLRTEVLSPVEVFSVGLHLHCIFLNKQFQEKYSEVAYTSFQIIMEESPIYCADALASALWHSSLHTALLASPPVPTPCGSSCLPAPRLQLSVAAAACQPHGPNSWQQQLLASPTALTPCGSSCPPAPGPKLPAAAADRQPHNPNPRQH